MTHTFASAKVQLIFDMTKSFANKMYIPQEFTHFYAAKTGFSRMEEEIKCKKNERKVQKIWRGGP